MYVAVKGGEKAIENAHLLMADRRRGDRSVPSLTLEQIAGQLALAVDRVMSEGALYDRDLAALAVKQARGDLIEAIFLVRAYRTTLPRFGYGEPIDTGAMHIERRISATYKDLPGGQMLGPTFDYTHRLLDPALAGDEEVAGAERREGEPVRAMRVSDILARDGLIESDGEASGETPGDITRTPLEFPMERDSRLQALSRGDEGFLLALGYSTQRGYARSHPFAGEIRIGEVDVAFFVPELGFSVTVGRIQVTASIIGPEDTLKVIDQGADDTTNAVSIRAFFARVARVATTTRTGEATVIQTRHRIPEEPLKEGQVLVYQVPIPEPLRFLEPRETETRKMHALEEYGLMHVKLYEDIVRNGRIATTYAYPVKVEGRYVMDPSPTPKFDNPKMNDCAALQLFGAGREKRIYAVPPYTEVVSLDFEDFPFEVNRFEEPCALCGAAEVYLDEVITDDRGGRMFVCSDTDHCEKRREAGHRGAMAEEEATG